MKGEDLLFLDQPQQPARRRRSATATARSACRRCRSPSVAVYAPPRRKATPTPGPTSPAARTGVHAFFWTLAEFCDDELLPFVFADAEDDRQQYTMVVHNVGRQPQARRRPAGDDGAWQIDGEVLRTYHDLVDLVVAAVHRRHDDVSTGPAAPIGMGTVNAFVRRLLSSQRALGRIIRADVAAARPTTPIRRPTPQVTVVDLHNLHDRAKRFVVGVTLQRAFERRRRPGSARPLLFVVLDELNKYAPREGQSPIKEILLDVAERGRSLGIILIGAQQTASEVERRIIANSAIRVVGRLDPPRRRGPSTASCPTAQRQRATIAKPGTMFVSQPEIPVPLVVEFPFPAWATRPDERRRPRSPGGHQPDDPFDGPLSREAPPHLRLARRQDAARASPARRAPRRPRRDRRRRPRASASTSSLVAGDLFESAAPPPEAEALVVVRRCSTCAPPAPRSS